MPYPATAVIFAGGNSTRMGQDKATLPVGQDTLVTEKIPWLEQHFEDVVLSAKDSKTCTHLDIPVIEDTVPNQGPLMGLYSAMMATTHNWVFALACDIANPPWPLIEELWHNRDNHQAILPRTDRGLEPLFAFYNRAALPALSEHLDAGMRSVHRFAATIDAKYIDANTHTFWNLNTPEDYHAYLQHRNAQGK